MEYNLRDLKFFEVVADLGHIGRAADALGRSQPAITKCIQRLESSVGGQLFSREGRGIVLTPVGQLLLTRSRELLEKSSEISRELHDFTHGKTGHVRIGGGLISVNDVIPDVCAKLLTKSTGTTFEIVIGPNVQLREDLRAGRLDILLGLIPTADPDFVTTPIVEDIVIAAARRNHPVFKRRDLELQHLLDYAWTLPSAPIPSRMWLDHAFTSRGLPAPTVQIETNSPSLLPRLVSSAALIGFLPRRMLLTGDGRRLREIDAPETVFQRQFGVTYRKGGYLSPAAHRLIDLIVAQGANLFG